MELRQRQPRIEDKAFLAFVRQHRCLSCGCAPPVQAAHLRGPCLELGKRQTGKGEKPSDRWALPLCPDCHLDKNYSLHRMGEQRFFARIGINPFEEAAKLYAAFEKKKGRTRNRSGPSG